MKKNEILKKSIQQNCDFGENGFFIEGDLLESIDSLNLIKNSAAKVRLCNLIKALIMISWKSDVKSLKMIIKEINLLAKEGNENGKVQ